MVRPSRWPVSVRLVFVLVASLVGLAVPARAEVALRPLVPVMMASGLEKSADPQLRAAIAEKAEKALQRELDTRFGAAAAAGRAREGGSSVQLELSDLLHLGMRISRARVRTVHYGSDRTDFHLDLTGTLFVVNLGTGEVLSARSLTARVTSKKSGNVGSPDGATLAALASDGVDRLAGELSQRLAAEFKPGRIEARVVDIHRGVAVLARGYAEGAYNGEVFTAPAEGSGPPRTYQVFQAQDHLSLARATGSFGLPKSGTLLSRVGMASTAGNTPRLMVARAESDTDGADLPPGVAPEDVDQWAEDLLADKGFVVIPSSGDLVRAQLAEAAVSDVAEKALVGAQVSPDMVVLARIDRSQLVDRFDEKTGTSLLEAQVTASLSFVDVRSGAVLFGTLATQARSDYVQEGGKQFDPSDSFPGLTKDAILTAAEQAATTFKPRRGQAKADQASGKSLSWKVDGVPLGLGTVVEVYRASREIKDAGKALGQVEELVGTARVVESDGKREKAQVMALAATAVPGFVVKAVTGTATADARLVAVGDLAVSVEASSASKWRPGSSTLRSHARTALFTSGAFKAVVDGDLSTRLARATAFLSSGAFAAGGDAVAEVKPASPTHWWKVAVKVAATALEAKGATLTRKYRVDVQVSLVDAETGTAVTLKRPNGDTMTEYPYYLERTLTAKEKKGQKAVGLGDDDVPAALEAVLIDALVEAASRTRKLADAGVAR